MSNFKLLGVKITGKDESALLSKIQTGLKIGRKQIIFTPNPEILVQASRDSKYKAILNKSDINIPDGVGITVLSKFCYGQKLQRIRGREFFLKLLRLADKNNLRVFFLGASKKVNEEAVNKARQDYPNANFDGASTPLLNRELQIDSEKDIVIYNEILDHINEYSPDVLFVALGAPKQEKWIINNLDLKAKIFMGVGGSLDYFVGKTVLPPEFISRLGLEWIWRLCFQPKRIFRIFNAVVTFPYLVFRERFFGKYP